MSENTLKYSVFLVSVKKWIRHKNFHTIWFNKNCGLKKLMSEKHKPIHKDFHTIRFYKNCGLKKLMSEKHTEVQCFFSKCNKVTKT